jgi:hypothetical protein
MEYNDMEGLRQEVNSRYRFFKGVPEKIGQVKKRGPGPGFFPAGLAPVIKAEE